MIRSEPFLFAADLDGTLLPNTGKPADSGCLERTRELLGRLGSAGHPVCFVTGRHLSLAREGVGRFGLPLPDWWVCNVGTEVYDRDGIPERAWLGLLGPELNQPTLGRALEGIEGLTPQEPDKQGAHKCSWYSREPASEGLQKEILARAARVHEGLQLITSVEESTGRGLLDVIPAAAGKARAVAYLARHHGIPLDRAFFAGDSGNDLDALVSGLCGTLVGNTPPEVRELARRLEFGRDDTRLYIAGACYGDGVIEGLRHYGLWQPSSTPVRAGQHSVSNDNHAHRLLLSP